MFGTCPYNKEHRILLHRMPGHIVKCERNYKGPPLMICKYNATHRLPAELMNQHMKECLFQSESFEMLSRRIGNVGNK